MPNPATVSDVEARWRSLNPNETNVAATRLSDGWRILRREVPDLDARTAASLDLSDDVRQVLADAVIRVLRDLERGGAKRASIAVDDASRSWEYDTATSGAHGVLHFTDAELDRLLPASGGVSDGKAFSVMPS